MTQMEIKQDKANQRYYLAYVNPVGEHLVQREYWILAGDTLEEAERFLQEWYYDNRTTWSVEFYQIGCQIVPKRGSQGQFESHKEAQDYADQEEALRD